MIIDIPTPLGSTIFCDDIREEVSGKTTYVGVYDGEMQLHAPLPGTIPKLCLSMSFRDDVERLLSEPMTFKVVMSTTKEERVLLEAPYTPPDPRPEILVPRRVGKPEGGGFTTVRLNVMLAPLVIPEECLIKSRLYRGDDEFLCGALRIVLADPPEPEPQLNL